MPANDSAFAGGKKSRTNSATAGYIKTGRKDGEGRIVYASAAGVERVRCKSKSTGRLEWRKVAKVATAGGAEAHDIIAKTEYDIDALKAKFKAVSESLDAVDVSNGILEQRLFEVENLRKTAEGFQPRFERFNVAVNAYWKKHDSRWQAGDKWFHP